MANRAHPLTVGVRVNAQQLARVDAAARLKGQTRSEYLRAVLLTQTERDLRAEFDGPAEGR